MFEIDNVLLISGFYSPEECQEELAFAKKAGFLLQQYGVPGRRADRRRAFVDDGVRSSHIWKKLNIPSIDKFFKDLKTDPYIENLAEWKAIGLNPRLRYYQYEVGDRFPRHFDITYRIDDDTRTLLTLIVYLDDGYEGGQTIFDNGVVVPKIGDAIIFPHELMHEGTMVTKGRKTVLRTDVMCTNKPDKK